MFLKQSLKNIQTALHFTYLSNVFGNSQPNLILNERLRDAKAILPFSKASGFVVKGNEFVFSQTYDYYETSHATSTIQIEDFIV